MSVRLTKRAENVVLAFSALVLGTVLAVLLAAWFNLI